MAKTFPVGTIRHWEQGDMIKAHDGSQFGAGWIPLQTSPEMETIGKDCDRLGNTMLSYTTPIDGGIFLDHEILEFNKTLPYGRQHFNPADFKQYFGSFGAGKYSFRNEFSKRFMKEKLDIQEQINEALIAANSEKGSGLGKSPDEYGKEDLLTREEKAKIRSRIREGYKADTELFSVDDAKMLQGIIERTYKQLKQGLNLEGKEKEIYDQAKSMADSISSSYERMKIKKGKLNDSIALINSTFIDNWGVRESFRKMAEDKYSEYIRKFSVQIKKDEGAEQQKIFGVSLDDHYDKFYNKLQKKLQDKALDFSDTKLEKLLGTKVTVEDSEGKTQIGWLHKSGNGASYGISIPRDGFNLEGITHGPKLPKDGFVPVATFSGSQEIKHAIVLAEYPTSELLQIRFETTYKKRLDGSWNANMIPALHVMEKVISTLPQGHAITNNDLKTFSTTDYDSGEEGGYAFYNPSSARINLSKDLVEGSHGVWSRMSNHQELIDTFTHEIGHAVDNKLGEDSFHPYREFAVLCGWSYMQHELLSGRSATGDAKSIKREGSNSWIPLLTEYAHKSKSEAFAEYYSIYAGRKEAFDDYLSTGDFNALAEKTHNVTKSVNNHGNTIGQVLKSHQLEPSEKYNDIHKILTQSNIDLKRHIKTELVSPWEMDIHDQERKNYNASAIKDRKDRTIENHMPPVVVLRDNQKQSIIEGVNRHAQAQMNQKLLPSVVVTEELWQKLKPKGITVQQLANYALIQKKDSPLPVQTTPSKQEAGFWYHGEFLPESKIKTSVKILQKMKEIYESEKIKKAVMKLFGVYTDRIKEIIDTDETQLLTDLKKAVTYQQYADALLFNNKGELLIMRRGMDTEFCPGMWCLPGGHVDPGEDACPAAMRELLEETNIDCVGARHVLTRKGKDSSTDYFYITRDWNKEMKIVLTPNEHYSYEWVGQYDLEKYEMIPGLKPILKFLFESISQIMSPGSLVPVIGELADDTSVHIKVQNKEVVKSLFDNDFISLEEYKQSLPVIMTQVAQPIIKAEIKAYKKSNAYLLDKAASRITTKNDTLDSFKRQFGSELQQYFKSLSINDFTEGELKRYHAFSLNASKKPFYRVK